MSLDYPTRLEWMRIRNSRKTVMRRLARFVFRGGTFVRKREDAKENARVQAYAAHCTMGFLKKHKREEGERSEI